MQERMEARQAEALFNAALHAAQQEMPRVAKNGTIKLVKDGVDRGSIPFTTFEDIDLVLRPIMQRHGFSLSFDMQMKEGGGAVITGTLRHSAGHAKTASIPLALDTGPGRNNLQAMGSTFSYGRRYVTEMFFNIVRTGADDDGVRGGMRFITDAQVAQLEGLIRQAGADRVGFLRWAGVDDLSEAEQKNFTALVNALNAKIAKIDKAPKPASGDKFL